VVRFVVGYWEDANVLSCDRIVRFTRCASTSGAGMDSGF